MPNNGPDMVRVWLDDDGTWVDDAGAEVGDGYVIVPGGPVKPPYGTPEREAYDRREGV